MAAAADAPGGRPGLATLLAGGGALADLFAATRFAILMAAGGGAQAVLAPFLEDKGDGIGTLSRIAAQTVAGEVLRHAMRRGEPTIFTPAAPEPASHMPARGAPLLEGEWVLALPVHSQAGRRGLVMLAAPTPFAADEDLVMRAHLRAFALFRAACAYTAPAPDRRHGLSPRDIECLSLTADGLTSEQLAERLGLSVHTANQYVSSAVEKLDAVNRMHAVAKALRAGIIS